MKILFLYPPSPFLLDEKALVPLGILQVAACLQEKGFQTDVLDLAGEKEYIKKAIDKISSDNYDAIGFSTTTQQTSKVVPLYNEIRKSWRNIHIVVGGPGPTVDPQTYINLGFDKIIRNEGEYAYQAWDNEGPQVMTMPLIHDLDSLPFPDRSLVDLKSYRFRLKDRYGKEYAPTSHIVSTRGCPFSCGFCCGRELEYYRRYREFSPRRIVAEMDHIAETYGITTFTDYCDELNIRKGRLIEFCDLVKDRGYKLRGFIVCKLFDEETAKKMAEAGFIEVCAGVESADNAILKISKINKTTVEDSLRGCKLAQKYGIRFKAFTMLGLPRETEESAMKLQDYLIKMAPDDYDIAIFLPMPGGPIYEHPEKNKDYKFDKLDFTKELAFYKGVPGEYKAYVNPRGMTRERLVELRDQIDREVRETLGMKQIKRAENRYDRSMGQR